MTLLTATDLMEYTRLRFELEQIRRDNLAAAHRVELAALTDKTYKSVAAAKAKGEAESSTQRGTVRGIDSVFHLCDNMVESELEMPYIFDLLIPYLKGVLKSFESTDGAA